MKKIFSITALLLVWLSMPLWGQKIKRAEYFYDKDPGFGKAKGVPFTNADSVDIYDSFPTTGLAQGYHNLFMRVQDSAGKWSLYEGRCFFINAGYIAITFSARLVHAEYFYDKDPGFGKGKAIAAFSTADSIDITDSLPTTGLATGPHILTIRAQDKNGIWSMYESRLFYIAPAHVALAPSPQLVHAEYFYDKDPGMGKGKAITAFTTADSIDITDSLPTTGLSSGFHTLTLRVQGKDGAWSLYETRLFHILSASKPVVTTWEITKAEYFIDKDPGVGKGTGISPSFTTADSINVLSNVNVSGLANGKHYLYVRVMDQGGIWSLTQGDSFIICSFPYTVNTGNDTTICKGSSDTLGRKALAALSYSWTSNPAGFTSKAARPVVSPSVATTYYLAESITANGCTNYDSVTVNLSPPPAVNAGADNTICSGSSTNIGATAVSGLSYSWTSKPSGFTSTSANPSVSPTVTTTYYLKGTNSTGCSNIDTVIITVNPLPKANTGSASSICAGNSLALGAASVSGDTYSWTSRPSGFTSTGSNPTVSPKVMTTYILAETITATGCSKTDSVTIKVNPAATANAGLNDTICSGGSAAIGSAAVSGYAYSWTSRPSGFTSTGAKPTVSPTVTTKYFLLDSIIATGCKAMDSVMVIVNPRPIANAGSNTSVCAGKGATIGAAAVSGSVYSWTSKPAGFSSASANPTVSPKATTVYYLTETIKATGCSKTDSVLVTVNPLPAANAGKASAICAGNSATIGATAVSGNTYSWTSKPAGYTSSLANPSVSPSVNTTYYLTETVTLSGCLNSDSVLITVNPLPAANAGTGKGICPGAGISLGAAATSGHTYSWKSNPAGFTSSSANPSVSPLATTTYYLTETITATGCTKSDSVTISLISLPAISISGPVQACLGDSLQYSANYSGSLAYAWKSGGGNIISGGSRDSVVVQWMAPGSHSLTLIETLGSCSDSSSYSVTVKARPLKPVISRFSDSLAVKGGNATSWQWYLNGTAISGATDSIYISTLNGSYTVAAMNGFCQAVSDPYVLTGLEYPDAISLLRIYPNPTTGMAYVDAVLTAPAELSLQLSDMYGQVLQNLCPGKISGSYKCSLDLNTLSKGIYLLRIKAGNASRIERIIRL